MSLLFCYYYYYYYYYYFIIIGIFFETVFEFLAVNKDDHFSGSSDIAWIILRKKNSKVEHFLMRCFSIDNFMKKDFNVSTVRVRCLMEAIPQNR